MTMKEHILAALKEQFDRWEKLLGGLSREQITAPSFDLGWSVKDVVTHLWGWQQISLARVEAAVRDSEPEFPAWLNSLHGDWEENADQTNAWIYKNFHTLPWGDLHRKWQDGFLQLLAAGGQVPEMDLLGSDRYPWLNGYPLAMVLVASYEHHQEHLDKLTAWLAGRGSTA